MSDDLQLQMVARIEKLMGGLDRVDDKLRKIDQQARKANQANKDFQAEVTQRFRDSTGAAEKFSTAVGRSKTSMTDLQATASKSLVDLKGKFEVARGIGLGIGGVASAVLTGITAAATAASKAIQDAKNAAAQVAETSGDKATGAAIALAGMTNVDAAAVQRTATTASGTATQDQINDFVRQLAQRAPGIDTATADAAIARFARQGAIPGAAEAVLKDVETFGSAESAFGTSTAMEQRLDTARRVDPTGIATLEATRDDEIKRIRLGTTDAARRAALAKRLRETSDIAEDVAFAGDTSAGRARRMVGYSGRWVGDKLAPGDQRTDLAEQQAGQRLGGGAPPAEVRVVNLPPPPVDGGY